MVKRQDKIYILFLCIILAFLQTGIAQEIEKSEKMESFEFETYSLQFRITSNFTLSQFQGSLLSFKYHFNNQNAIRFGVGLRAQNWSDLEEQDRIAEDSSYYSVEHDNNSVSLDITTQWLHYFRPKNVIKVYLGAGPLLFYDLNKTDAKNLDTLNNSQVYTLYSKVDRKQYGIGISTAYGVEWFFHNHMSLLAEYGFEIYYYQLTYETELIRLWPEAPDIVEKRKSKENGWVLNSSSLKFGISIYF